LTFTTERADSYVRQRKESTSHANATVHPQQIPGGSQVLEILI